MRTQRKYQLGFSLVQMIMSIGILSIILLSFADTLVGLQKEVSRNKSKQDRALNFYQIDQIFLSSYGLKASADLLPENNDLKACIKGGATSSCASDCCTNGQAFDFVLVDPRDTNTDIHKRMRLGGSLQTPAAYNDASSPGCVDDCAYTISTSFIAQCPGGAATCDHAEHLAIKYIVEPVAGKEHKIRRQERNSTYFVNLNYEPFISPIGSQSIGMDTSSNLLVNGNAGHPSEVQNFIFKNCAVDDPAIAKITCYGFLNGVGTVKIDGVAAGTTRVNLQIDDGGIENNLSPELSFDVVVTP